MLNRQAAWSNAPCRRFIDSLCGPHQNTPGDGRGQQWYRSVNVGVLFFVVGGFQEQSGDLLKGLFLGLGGEIGVLVPGLGVPGESGLRVLLSLGPGVFGHKKRRLF